MKLLLSILILIFFSCSQNKTAPAQQSNVPKALEENKTDFSIMTKRYDNDIVQNLYEEILKENKNLQNFETGIIKIKKDKVDSLEYFHSFTDKNVSYYSKADYYLSSIKDSVLKNRVKQIITESRNHFESSMVQHKNLIQQIDSKENKLADLHITVKIINTLPIIEKYQQEKHPSLNPIESINNEFNKLLNEGSVLSKKL